MAPFSLFHIFLSSPESGGGGPEESPDSPDFWIKIAISACLVLAGGVFAGLTLGLMGLEELHLRVLATSSDNPVEKRNAQKVLRLMRRGRHWVLVVSFYSYCERRTGFDSFV
jgi:metal transporter CNNM